MIRIDGSSGEGGGQVLRTALALALVTGTPFQMVKIRAGRSKPGLLRQHLTAVKAAAAVSGAELEGSHLNSQELTFRPGRVTPGDYHFAVGTAGSATLVLQTVLPALLDASAPSTLKLEGGTHNPAAPPFDFLVKSYLPLVRRMGPGVEATLERPGFFPAGGGRFRVNVRPAPLQPLHLMERGAVVRRQATAMISQVPFNVAKRELEMVGRVLDWGEEERRVEEFKHSSGPGNVLSLEVESEHVTEVFTGFGERGVPAESIAVEVAKEVQVYLHAGVPVGPHLCDQLLLLLALAREGSFRTVPFEGHAHTQLKTFAHFLDVRFDVKEVSSLVTEVRVGRVST
ncbi:RNA 3'-terminal-phosphate cyclase [Archangium sp. Cb G35]|uniref:RNA 3'-terminal phosphate cyclase n=1 Tax=Archangium sp. Cb G35 TaxID=1920190 RepID=UPI00093691F7|nr:RNA 3'-terminal phosphate cyclase [Archangium sp. Cb G35]OJT18979.1 RNA 3'-terminal-phosphate cyclase [Archangium sp. Cb G35]